MKKRSVGVHKSNPVENSQLETNGRFTTITISNFRCFKDFSINSLSRINLIGGKNNVGKTTLLEAMFLLLGATNIELVLRINAFRGAETFEGNAASIRESVWGHIFHDFDDQATITIYGELVSSKKISVTLKQTFGSNRIIAVQDSSQEKISSSTVTSSQTLKLQYTDIHKKPYVVELQIGAKGINIPAPKVEPLFPGIFLSARRRSTFQENATRFGQLEIKQSHSNLLPSLQIIEPRLKRLSTIVVGNTPMLYGDIGLERMLPLSAMGDGLGGLLTLLLAISSAPGGVVLIDELENGLHYSSLTDVWSAIAEVARIYDTQVFATTHSWECIKAANDAFKASSPSDFRYHRLQQSDDNKIVAITFDQDTLQTSIDSGWEIR